MITVLIFIFSLWNISQAKWYPLSLTFFHCSFFHKLMVMRIIIITQHCEYFHKQVITVLIYISYIVKCFTSRLFNNSQTLILIIIINENRYQLKLLHCEILHKQWESVSIRMIIIIIYIVQYFTSSKNDNHYQLKTFHCEYFHKHWNWESFSFTFLHCEKIHKLWQW